eukprot:scaffold41680_cov30-Tisochrysis_lutea.AAC.2
MMRKNDATHVHVHVLAVYDTTKTLEASNSNCNVLMVPCRCRERRAQHSTLGCYSRALEGRSFTSGIIDCIRRREISLSSVEARTIDEVVGGAHEEGPGKDVSESYRDQVGREECLNGDFGTIDHAKGDHRHVGNRVLEAHGNKG